MVYFLHLTGLHVQLFFDFCFLQSESLYINVKKSQCIELLSDSNNTLVPSGRMWVWCGHAEIGVTCTVVVTQPKIGKIRKYHE